MMNPRIGDDLSLEPSLDPPDDDEVCDDEYDYSDYESKADNAAYWGDW